MTVAALPRIHLRASSDGLSYPAAEAPFYLAAGDEVRVFEACQAQRLAVMLKGPTGCGKTRFVEHMAWRLGRPLVTVACHDDLSASDLLGRYLVRGGETEWRDGPLTRAVRSGDRDAVAHRGQRILQTAPRAHMHVHIARRREGQAA